uniref:Antitoxin n=1 Tax=Geoglobus ahangari TaxID=113653 RepID=A0A7C3YD63_9EURY
MNIEVIYEDGVLKPLEKIQTGKRLPKNL